MSISLNSIRRCIVAVCFTASAVSPASPATPRDTLVIAAAIDDIISLDPGAALEITSGEILGNAYDRLVRFDPKNPGSVSGDIAESWTIAPDGKTYTFRIKSGLRFASGNPLTADDVAFSFERAVKLDKSPAFLLTQLGLTRDNVNERATAQADGTFKLTVGAAYAPNFVLNCLSTNVGAAVDKRLVLEHEKSGDFGNGWLQSNYAGSGPMRLRDWRANEIVVLDRNENYYGDKPKLARVIYRHIKESATQRLMLEAGDIDIARNLEPGDLEAVSKNEKLKLISTLNGTLYYISLNMKNPKLAKPEIRQAFKYLVDYDAIGETLIKGIGVIHQDFLPSGLPGATSENPFKFDIARAKALLAKAGFAEGLEVTFDVRTNQPVTGIAESFQRTAAEAGVKVAIIPGNGKQTLTKYRGRKHDLYIGEWSLKYWDPHANADAFSNVPDISDDAKYQTLAWRNGWNAKDETAKTAAALVEPNSERRIEIYRDLLREFTAASPFVMIFQMRETGAVSKKVENFVLGPLPYTNFVYTASKS